MIPLHSLNEDIIPFEKITSKKQPNLLKYAIIIGAVGIVAIFIIIKSKTNTNESNQR